MLFKPRDEISLRHLFSSSYAQEVLGLSYVGPVLNPDGSTIESSPDGIILDMRKHPFQPIRCEFKYIPCGHQEFAHNGRFDLAIVWSLPSALSRDKLLAELLTQNNCAELIVLADLKAFRDLPNYTVDSLSRLGNTDIVRDHAIKSEFPSVLGLCIAAQLYPDKFQMDRMIEFLSHRFPEVKKMQPKGRANVITAFIQSKPPFIERMHGRFYRWTSEIDSCSAAAELNELITANFGKEPPSKDDLEAVRE